MMSSQIVPQGYRMTKVGVIPEDWDLFRTDSILQRVRKKVEVEKYINYQQIGIRSHAKGIFHKELVTGKELGNKSVFWIEEDCFIVNIVFAWEQAVAKTTENEMGMIASHRFPIYQPKDNKIDIDYLLYFFKSKRGKHLLGLASPGGAGRNKTLGQGEFSELKIPLPSLKEQQKIAKILTTWDDAISKQDKLIKAKEEFKKGLMQKLLSGEVRFGGFSDEWKFVRLGEIGEIVSGLTYSPKNIDKNGILVLRSSNVKNRKLKFIDNVFINMDSIKFNPVVENDILICIRNGSKSLIGKNALIDKENEGIAFGAFMSIYRSQYNLFLFQLFDTKVYKREVYRNLGATINSINGSDFKKFKIPFPPLPEQQKIVKVLSTADKEIDLLKNELQELKEQKKGLMQKLLTGKVRVKI